MLVLRHLYILLYLLQVPGVPCEPVHQGIECDGDKPGILCLAKDYSTFDLPFRTKPDLIKIGKKYLSEYGDSVSKVFA